MRHACRSMNVRTSVSRLPERHETVLPRLHPCYSAMAWSDAETKVGHLSAFETCNVLASLRWRPNSMCESWNRRGCSPNTGVWWYLKVVGRNRKATAKCRAVDGDVPASAGHWHARKRGETFVTAMSTRAMSLRLHRHHAMICMWFARLVATR